MKRKLFAFSFPSFVYKPGETNITMSSNWTVIIIREVYGSRHCMSMSPLK